MYFSLFQRKIENINYFMVQRISTDNYLRCGTLVWKSSRNKITEKSIMSVMTFATLVYHDSPTITMTPVSCII